MLLERLLRNALELQAIPAPTGQEGARADHLRGLLTEAGPANVESDVLGNLYADVMGGSGKVVVVSAHLDSVFPPHQNPPAQHEGRRLIGPGIGDNALGLAALVELAHDLQAAPLPGNVWLVANVGEEGMGNLEGMRAVVARFGPLPQAYLVLEGIGLGQIHHEGLPARRYRIQVTTEGGHAWIHSDRPSAVHMLLRLGEAISALELPSHPRTTLNIGVIQGGTSVNTIADQAWMEVDIRSYDTEPLEHLDMAMRKLCKQASARKIQVICQLVGERPSGGIPADHPLVEAAMEALRHQGVRPQRPEPASTDASVPLSKGLPALCLGLTLGAGAHSQREYIEIEPIHKGYEALLELIRWAISP